MSDHRTAEIIGAHMALSSPIAIAWCRVMRGEITPEEAAALMGSAEERELALRVFRPPTDEHREALLATLLARLSARDTGACDSRGGTQGDVEACGHEARRKSPKDARAARTVHDPAMVGGRAWRWRWLVPATMAATVAVALLLRAPEERAMRYTLEPLMGDSIMRGAPAASPLPSYSRGSRLYAVLRPNEPVESPVALVAFARSSGGQISRLELRPEIASNGLVTIDVPISDTGLHDGEWELVLVVGRPSALPSSWSEIERAEEAGKTPGYAVMYAVLRVG